MRDPRRPQLQISIVVGLAAGVLLWGMLHGGPIQFLWLPAILAVKALGLSVGPPWEGRSVEFWVSWLIAVAYLSVPSLVVWRLLARLARTIHEGAAHRASSV